MQKLTYQNLRGERAVFGCAPPYILCKVRGLGMSDMDIESARGNGQQGESVLAVRRQTRDVSLTLHLWGESRADMYRRRVALCGILSPDRAFDGENRSKLIYENDYGSWWTWAVPENGLDWGDRIRDIHPQVKLNFLCESPFWFSMKPSAVTFKSRRAGFTLPMRFPVELGSSVFSICAHNGGLSSTPVTVSIQGCGEMPTLFNRSTGAQIKLVAPLPVGDTLTIVTDPARLTAQIKHPDGASENAYGLLDPETSIAGFRLRPGDNELVYQPDTDRTQSVIRVEWYECFEGV